MIKLIMLSGGLDSTYILYDAVKNSEDKIWVHHIVLKNSVEVRWKEELIAARKVMEYCRKIRSFPYSESEWGFHFKKYFVWDIDVIAFTAAQIVPNIAGEDKVTLVTGRVKEDDNNPLSVQQLEYTQTLWEAASKKFAGKVEKDILKPIREKHKKELITELPLDLLNMVWYCRNSDQGRPCGKCKSCKDMAEARKSISR
jgi:7-cyano-7-deazaguanine synthase in queuosine biosynthesis